MDSKFCLHRYDMHLVPTIQIELLRSSIFDKILYSPIHVDEHLFYLFYFIFYYYLSLFQFPQHKNQNKRDMGCNTGPLRVNTWLDWTGFHLLNATIHFLLQLPISIFCLFMYILTNNLVLLYFMTQKLYWQNWQAYAPLSLS